MAYVCAIIIVVVGGDDDDDNGDDDDDDSDYYDNVYTSTEWDDALHANGSMNSV